MMSQLSRRGRFVRAIQALKERLLLGGAADQEYEDRAAQVEFLANGDTFLLLQQMDQLRQAGESATTGKLWRLAEPRLRKVLHG